MDKRLIMAVAGSGKTTYIVNSLSEDKRTLIVTYTNANYRNLRRKISVRFHDEWPKNTVLMTYFHFLYSFCFKPFLSDIVNAKGIVFDRDPNHYHNYRVPEFYMNHERFLYSNRLAYLIEVQQKTEDVKNRLKKYFDYFIIDEVQDISGRDFNFLKLLMPTAMDMLFVGDFFQHTFDTSRDGSVNRNLFQDKTRYESYFAGNGFIIDETRLSDSWRCSKSICEYVSSNLGIRISSNRSPDDNTQIYFIEDVEEIKRILYDSSIIKLHYKNGAKFGLSHKNWGETKGEDNYSDICVLLNPTTMQNYRFGRLNELSASTKNKLYVALTRAHGNVFLIEEKVAEQLIDSI